MINIHAIYTYTQTCKKRTDKLYITIHYKIQKSIHTYKITLVEGTTTGHHSQHQQDRARPTRLRHAHQLERPGTARQKPTASR